MVWQSDRRTVINKYRLIKIGRTTENFTLGQLIKNIPHHIPHSLDRGA